MDNELIKQNTVNMNEKYIIEQYNHTKNDFNGTIRIKTYIYLLKIKILVVW